MSNVDKYLRTFESLRQRKRWDTNLAVLRFAAVTLAAGDIDDPATDLERAARVLRENAGWTSPLRSSIRYAVAAMIVRSGLDPGRVHARVEEVRASFRGRHMRRGGTHEVLAALLLALSSRAGPVDDRAVDRTRDLLKRWKADHWFLTGVDDYPLAALHALRDVAVEEVGVVVEQVYQRLRAMSYSGGNQLQLASHLLAASSSPSEATTRFDAIARSLRKNGLRIGSNRYDEVAILSLTSSSPVDLARRVIADRDRLRSAKPRPTPEVAFSLAAGLALAADSVLQTENVSPTGDLAAVKSAQAVLAAQQAAIVAAVSAATVATAATSSSR